MDIKNAAKVINDELKKLKTEVGQWHLKKEEIFNDLTKSYQSEHNKTIDFLKDKINPKEIVATLKNYEKENQKIIHTSTQQVIDLNTDYSVKIKKLSKNLGEIGAPYLNTVKSNSFGTSIKAQSKIQEEIINFINNDLIKEFNADNLINSLNKKMTDLTKNFNQQGSTETEHLQYMAKIELFCDKLINAMGSSTSFSKSDKKWIETNYSLSSLVYELDCKQSINKIDKALNEIKNISDSDINSLVNSYGVSPDEDSLKRSKSAMKGVKDSFSYFKQEFKDSISQELSNVQDGLNIMYLNDMLDHLNLGKACLINDTAAMYENYSMDTASRELMSNSLHDYLNSDKFFDNIKEQKKSKKKIKP